MTAVDTKASGAQARESVTFDGLLDQLKLHVRPGMSRINFEVDPPELGRLSIQLVLRGDRLVGEIAADSVEVGGITVDTGIELLRNYKMPLDIKGKADLR